MKSILITLFTVIPSVIWADDPIELDKEEIAKHYGYSKLVSLGSVDRVYEDGGMDGLKDTLFHVTQSSKHYVVSQKVGGYFIYVKSRSAGRYSILPTIAVRPLEGEVSGKDSFLPGKYYRVLDLVEFTKLDGFPITLPLLERVMDKEKMVGYGDPPNDDECREIIIGWWSDGWHKYLPTSNEFINIDIYKRNGVYESIRYSHQFPSGKWKKELSFGTWEIKNAVINRTYEESSEWEQDIGSSSWVIRKNPPLGSGVENDKIIKLSDSNLITARRSERDYSRLQSLELSELLIEK